MESFFGIGLASLLLFCTVILLANIMQGITGFAGTILAMPVSLMLVGYAVAKPVLNVLGILGGVYVFLGCRKNVDWKELIKICVVMFCGIMLGLFVKGAAAGYERYLYMALGIFVIVLALQRMGQLFIHPKKVSLKNDGTIREKKKHPVARKLSVVWSYAMLVLAGIVHGIFVCGGPLLIGYLAKKVTDRKAFRATISTVWIFLNSFILAADVVQGYWSGRLSLVALVTVPFLWGGMKIGSILYAHMNQKVFMTITYGLLLVSGISLVLK